MKIRSLPGGEPLRRPGAALGPSVESYGTLATLACC